MSNNQDNGNAAAMRYALVKTLDAIKSLSRTHNDDLPEDVCAILGRMAFEVNEALSAPPRQCDVGTPEEKYQRWVHFCEQRLHSCYNCECKSPVGCTFKFGDMPYVAEEGDGK